MVYGEVRGLHQAAYILGLFAFGSQLLALVRDRLLAHQFGAGVELDLYYAAFKVPDLLYVLFASTLSVYVLIPFVTRRQADGGDEKARQLLSQIFTLFLIAYIALAALLVCMAPVLVGWLFPGLQTESGTLVVLLQILLLQPLFLGISSLFGVVTQLGHRFILYAISPLLYNLGIIFGIGILYPIYGLAGLVIGVVLGAVGHMLVQWPLVRSSSLGFGFTKHFDMSAIKDVLKVSIPRAATLTMHQAVLLVFVSVASVMAVGSVSVFQFAFNLQAVPLAVIGASYSIAAFPLLANLHANEKTQEFASHLIAALRHIMFWAVPAIGLIIVLRAQMVRVVLGSGEFDWNDTDLTAAALALLVVSLVAQAINLLIVRSFYAGGDTKTPFWVTLFGSVFAVGLLFFLYAEYSANTVLATQFASLMRLDDPTGSEVLLLAVAYSVAIIIQTCILTVLAAKQFKISFAWFPRHLLHTIAAATVGATAAYATINFIVVGINQDTFIGIFMQGLSGGVIGVIGVVLTYLALGTRELQEVMQSFRTRLFNTDVVAPQEDVLS